MGSPSDRKQKVKVCHEQQHREIRNRRDRLRGIQHNDIRCAQRRPPRRQRTPCKSGPADACSSGDATSSQAKRGEACCSCPPCQSACRSKAWTWCPSGAAPSCASAPYCHPPCASAPCCPPSCASASCCPPPHPQPCALLGEAGRSAVACRCAPRVGMDHAGVDDRRGRRLLLRRRLLL